MQTFTTLKDQYEAVSGRGNVVRSFDSMSKGLKWVKQNPLKIEGVKLVHASIVEQRRDIYKPRKYGSDKPVANLEEVAAA